jgi:hypothetical protein
MNASFMNKHTKLALLASLLAGMFSLSAQAAVYPNTFGDSGVIPQDGSVFSVEHTIGGIAPTVTSLELILTFNDSSSLAGNSSGIQGHVILGGSDTSPFVNFYPVAPSSSGQQRIYDVTFNGAPGQPGSGFNGSNPNDIWSLVLWDNSTSGIENGLVSWSLDITAVPEPVNIALGIFAGVFVVGGLCRTQRVRNQIRRGLVGINQWLDAV